MAYDAGSAFLQIVPSFKGVVDAIDAQAKEWATSAAKIFTDTFNDGVSRGTSGLSLGPSDSSSTRQGSSSGGKFADGFRAKVDAALKALPDAKIDADSSEADAKIDDIRTRLETIRNLRIGIDITDADALSSVEILKGELDELGAKSPNIRVKVDAAEASAQLAAIDAEAAGAGGGLSSLGEDAGAAAGDVSLLIPAIGALIAALVPLAALAGGALAALPAIFAGAAAGGAALKIGLSGISGAIGAYGKPAPKTGGGGGSSAASDAAAERSAANTVISAREAVANATQSAANSIHSAQENLQSSNEALAQSERNEANAQQAVIDARTQAQRQLDDYTNQLADASLAAQQAALDVQTAQANLTQVDATPGATSQQKAQAQLDYDTAVQHVTDLATQNAQLQQDAAAAAKAGVEGNSQVVASEQQLSDAQQGVVDATQHQADAQTALSQAQTGGVQQVADANRALSQALDAQATAMQKSGAGATSAASATKTYAQQLAALTPAGQAFVTFVTGTLEPMYDNFKKSVQSALLPGVTVALTDMLPFFQALEPFITQAALGIGWMAAGIGAFLGSAAGLSDTNAIFSAGAGFMEKMGQAILAILPALGTIGKQASPIVNALGDGILHLVQSFAKWVAGGGFENFVKWLQKNGPEIVSDISRFVTGIGRFLVGIEPIGQVLLGIISYVAAFLGWLGKTPAALAAVTLGLGALGIALFVLADSNPVGLIITAIALLIVGIIELVTHWGTVWAEIKAVAQVAWTFLWNNLFGPISNFFTKTIPNAFDTVVGFFSGIGSRIGKAATGMWDGIMNAFKTVLNTIIGWWDDLHFKIPGFSLGPVHFGGFDLGLPQIPKFHSGGVVPGVPGAEILAILQAGEAVFTPNQLASFAPSGVDGGGSSSPVIGNLNITAYDPQTAITETFNKAAFYAKTRGR